MNASGATRKPKTYFDTNRMDLEHAHYCWLREDCRQEETYVDLLQARSYLVSQLMSVIRNH